MVAGGGGVTHICVLRDRRVPEGRMVWYSGRVCGHILGEKTTLAEGASAGSQSGSRTVCALGGGGLKLVVCDYW